MWPKLKLLRILFIIGIIAIILGAVDPLEGSILILTGSVFLSLSTYFSGDRQWKIFLYALIFIAFGVFFLFYLSSLGGFGGDSTLSWWWGILILPYPIGWIFTIVLLIFRIFRKIPDTEQKE